MKHETSQKSEAAVMHPSGRTLLTLPGELRNHINTFATEANEAPLQRSSSHACPNELSEGRQFYNLTQVCRQIRSEFLPIYGRDNTVRLQYPALDPYLNDHVRQVYDEEVSIGNIVVDVKARGACLNENDEYMEVDILPAMMLCRNAPNLHIRFGTVACKWCGSASHDSELSEALNAFFELDEHAALAKYLEEAVGAVKLQYPPRVTFQIREGHWQAWMKEWKPDHRRSRMSSEMNTWCEQLGLSVASLIGASCFERYQGAEQVEK